MPLNTSPFSITVRYICFIIGAYAEIENSVIVSISTD